MAVEKKAPSGLRKVFAMLKAEIGATKEPHAVAKALLPMLREHVAKLKAKPASRPASAKAVRTGARKSAAPATRAGEASKKPVKTVRRRTTKRAPAPAEAPTTTE